MAEIAVSIIIPIYNAESFLRKGLDSCVGQTLQNIEILCVNDVSTDRSSDIIKEYVNKYPDKVMYLGLAKKSGQGGARNQGILHAKGEFLCFMDSDDYLDTHLCEEVYKKAKAEDADIVFYDYIRIDGQQEYHVELIGEEELGVWYQQIGCAPWQQMIKREVILENRLFFPENIRADDDAIVPLWRYYAKKRCKMQKPYYYYVNRQNSLVNEIKLSSIMSPVINVIPYRYKIMRQKGMLERFRAESDWMIARDICVTLKRFMQLDEFFTLDNMVHMREKVDFLDGHVLNESIIKYNLSCAEMDMVKVFLQNQFNELIEKYNTYTSFTNWQIEWGLDRSIEPEIEKILLALGRKYGSKMAIWGRGVKGVPIISTLMRMGYDFPVYDNVKHGQKIWENSNKYIYSIEDMKLEDVVMVTSDVYYKVIEEQIHKKNPHIGVVNFVRLIRNMKIGEYLLDGYCEV